MIVTDALKTPTAEGLTANVTVRLVDVAAVTLPEAPLLKVTILLEGVVEKPIPLMTTVDALMLRLVVALVTTGMTEAICTAIPLEIEFDVTTAVRFPTDVGLVEKVTNNDVAVAVVTVPTAPLLKTTVLLAAVVLKPKPLIVIVFASTDALAVAMDTVGFTVAT